MDKGLAKQVDERLLSVNPTDAQQDYIIMTANHWSPCQPHLQMEKCFPEKVMNIIMLKNICWPSLSLSSKCGGGKNRWLLMSLWDILSSLFMVCSGQVWFFGFKTPSGIHTGPGHTLWLYADDGENILCVTVTEIPIMIPLQEILHHTSAERNILHLEENVTNGTFWYCRLLPESRFWWSRLLIR